MKLAFLVLITALISASAAPATQFIVVSDIHFNPVADPDVAKQLLGAEPSEWERIFAGDTRLAEQKYGDDSNWRLLAALVSELENRRPRAAMILITGDVLAHRFRERLAAAVGKDDDATLRTFVRKTFAFLSVELEKAAGGAPVIYSPGNNDQECGDYALQPNGSFLEDTAGQVQRLTGQSLDVATWRAIGSYVIPNPVKARNRIIALNTNFWSRRYKNACGSPSDDPGASVLKWVSSQLKDAQKNKAKVWLVYHIPPGIDGHTSSRSNDVVPMWKEPYANGFNKLLDEYRGTISFSFAGHTHLDDIRLVKTEKSLALTLITPGLSPNVGQNPAFRVVTVDRKGQPKDLQTWIMPSLELMQWKLEYSAREAYRLKRIDATSYQALYKQLDNSSELSAKWKLYYSVSRPAGLADNKAYLRSLYCATGHSDAGGYRACLSANQ